MAEEQTFRVVTASSLFDGHDAAINVMRRLIQKAGIEVVHLGHNRSVDEIVRTAIEEDADGICVSSYQGGHMEFYRYMVDLLKQRGASHIQIFGGGGGTILPSEIQQLHEYGVARLYHAEDGRMMGLNGVINDLKNRLKKVKRPDVLYETLIAEVIQGKTLSQESLSIALSLLETPSLHPHFAKKLHEALIEAPQQRACVVGMTGTGGAGKSSLLDEIITRFLYTSRKARIGVLAFDPTKKKTGGALLGDRIRMNSIYDDRVFFRSMGTRDTAGVGAVAHDALRLLKCSDFDLILLETTGVGQGNTAVVDLVDLSIYTMTSEYGASTQLEKIDMIDYSDVIVVNKFDKMGAEDAFEDVLHAYARSRGQKVTPENRENFPLFGTTASTFNDLGVTKLFCFLIHTLKESHAFQGDVNCDALIDRKSQTSFDIIPPHRSHYLHEIAHEVHSYKKETEELVAKTRHYQQCCEMLSRYKTAMPEEMRAFLQKERENCERELEQDKKSFEEFLERLRQYQEKEYHYQVRDRTITRQLKIESLSGLMIPRIALPRSKEWGELKRFVRMENLPGYFPFTAGVFPFKNKEEDPKRQFAGEGSPARTNRRFHYLSKNDKAKRLSTAFDSVTLYGEDPAQRPDIYGKVGNSGVSIATLEHMKTLFKDFDLVAPLTSVSLTINGPAPMILAMFLNAAIDFEVEKVHGKERDALSKEEYEEIRCRVLQTVRGTVQADILKEEQAQNTCIFSSKFSLKLMGDIQEYFIRKGVRNFYSVSISGYHIAEAGANPISQLAFTLANGFTYVEYYLARGMHIDDFASNLSFFFSMGLDPEYSVIGRVARRIWAVVMREKYGANERSCKLKYHVQTSGRSLHAQEIAYNDIRTTLQALMAVYDHCNSLHTNAYDEAITTPTEESVRRAMAIQMIITHELGTAKCENSLQGSFLYEELTELVEEAVLAEFEALSRRGGVLGAMEKQYQRHRIQTESMHYEMQKASGELPLIGVNTFLSEGGQEDYENIEVIRATEEEKQEQIVSTRVFIEQAGKKNEEALRRLRLCVLEGRNVFEELMETVKYASLGQITHLLYQCGGEYRRSM